MSSKNKKTKTNQKDTVNLDELRKPWIKKGTGLIVITIVSIALAVLTAAQIVMGSGDWGKDKEWHPKMDADTRAKLYKGWKKAVTRTFDWVEN